MDKKLFLSKLKKELANLPKEEQKRALSYYEEYLEDASEDEIRELESPHEIAKSLILEYGSKNEQKEKKQDLTILWIILAIFASPILLTIGCLIFSALLLVWSLVLALAIIAFVFGIVGVAIGIFSFFAIPTTFPTFLLMIGISLLCIVVALLDAKFTYFIATKIVSCISFVLNKIIKRGVKDETV